ncbi:nose resistant to fluoxetine protein 6-like [Ornithodoros turicata]|uniref:nose resistant to fluoxetine protein 6-like n=1 Tax=Ornithodoros turicata TaxID=34597 RepID=UPI003138991B
MAPSASWPCTKLVLCLVFISGTCGRTGLNASTKEPEFEGVLRTRIIRAVESYVTDAEVTERPPSLRNLLDEVFEKVAKLLLPYVQELAYDENIPTECMRSWSKIGAGVRRLDFWALKFIDSMGRPPPGIMEGTVGSLGAYDECRSIRVPAEDPGVEDFRGRYCSLYFKPSGIDGEGLELLERFMKEHPLLRHHLRNLGNITLMFNSLAESAPEHAIDAFGGMRFGACIPSTCQGKDLKYMAEKLTKKYGIDTTVRGCSVDGPIQLTTIQIVMFFLIGSSCLLIGTASVLELYLKHREKKAPVRMEKRPFIVQLLLGFSGIRNTRILMNTKVVKNSDQHRLRCLHGMRVFSFLWVVIGHTYSAVEPQSVGRGEAYLEYLHDFVFVLIMNGFLAVETFFFMSGFLTSYGVIVMHRSASIFKLVPVSIIVRYIRLTIPALGFVGFCYVYPLIPRGPIADEWLWFMLRNCDKNWWDVLLQTTNYRPALEMCMPHLWYLGTDYQLFLIMILFVFFMAKKPKYGVPLLGIIVLVCSIALGAISYVNEYGPLAFTSARGVDKTLIAFKELYHKPITHIAPFTLGILAAYFILTYPNYRIGRKLYYTGWVAAWVGGLGCLYAVYPWNIGGSYTNLGSSMHTAGYRILWGLCLVWVVFVCGTRQSKWVNGFLSHPFWVPLSRLCFAGYMFHILVVAYKILTARQNIYVDHWIMVNDFFSHTVITALVSYIFFLVCECPVSNVVKVTLQKLFPEIERPNQFSFADSAQAKPDKEKVLAIAGTPTKDAKNGLSLGVFRYISHSADNVKSNCKADVKDYDDDEKDTVCCHV